MSADELPESLLCFLQTSIPTFPSAELLLFLASHSDQRLTPVQIVMAMKPAAINVPAATEYLTLFKKKNLVTGDFERGFQFAPTSPELQAAVNDLVCAYNERPVTLVRTIYMLAENKIQSFADSFRLKKG